MISRSEPGSRNVYKIFSALALISALATVCAGESEFVGERLVMKLALGGRSLSRYRSPDARRLEYWEPKLLCGECVARPLPLPLPLSLPLPLPLPVSCRR